MEVEINGKSTCFLYDASGERTIKRGENGETLYVDKFYQVQNRSIVTRHIFVGETRIVSRLSHHGYVDSKSHLQSRWLFPSQKSFKGIAFELIFFEILYTTSKGGGFLLAVNMRRVMCITITRII